MIGMNLLAIAALLTVALAIPSMFSGRPKGGFTSHLFNNQYFFNYEFANEDSNVNILFIAGEQNAGLQFVKGDNSYVHYASQLNASLYASNIDTMEIPIPLNIAEFIRQKNEREERTEMDRSWWIVCGALSAWSRLIHPELIVGSLSSSAPLLAQMDFYGYLQTVEEDLKKIGGPCHDS
ncbi:hypothetical protein PRIPAC_81426, partial [Pristionchus pacificus]|uniref:Peptidase n=1 Tax=Pristionchus pacificus TaxID=54126 RepID=A0A2A6BVL0_PRIPA